MMLQLHLSPETRIQIEDDRENKASHLVYVLSPTILRSAFNVSERKQARGTNWQTGREECGEMKG